MSVTILEIARELGVESNDGVVNAAEIMKWGLPFMGGCQHCAATIACYNAAPTSTGMLQCVECADGNGVGYATVDEAIAAIYEGRTADQVRAERYA